MRPRRDSSMRYANLVVNGHDHTYERFAPQTRSGELDGGGGLRQFIGGTRGKSHGPLTTDVPTARWRTRNTFGVLKLRLRPSSYEWDFVPEAGRRFTDSGSTRCH